MKKLLGVMVLSLLLRVNAYAEWLIIVKNKVDENIFIKRTKIIEEEAVNAALEGCLVMYRNREDLKKKKKIELMEACYVFSVIEQ